MTKNQNLNLAGSEQSSEPATSYIITIDQVYSLYDELNQLHFKAELPACKLELSSRLTSTAGKIWPKERLMRLSLPYHQRYGLEELKNTILHEQIHLWLHEKNLPSGHTATFRQKLEEVGLADRLHALQMPRRPYKYVYICPTCKRQIQTRRRIKSSCGKCDTVFNPKHHFRLLKKLDKEK